MKGTGENKQKGKKDQGGFRGLYFLTSVSILYVVMMILSPDKTASSISASGDLLLKIIPVLLLVILCTALMKYYISPKTVKKYVGSDSGVKGWFLAIAAGMLSHGPIYVWFTLLKELRDNGMSNGLVAVFLYNRAVKIPLLPMMIALLGGKLVIILLFYMFAASLIQGMVVKLLLD